MSRPGESPRAGVLHRRGVLLEWTTLGWNVVGVAVLAVAATRASSVALAGFGLDSAIEIGASTVVLWELSGTGLDRQRKALRLIGVLVGPVRVGPGLGASCTTQPGRDHLDSDHRRGDVRVGGWESSDRSQVGQPGVDHRRPGHLHRRDLAAAVLVGIVLDTAAGWWWADPAAGLIIVYYALREARHIFHTNEDG